MKRMLFLLILLALAARALDGAVISNDLLRVELADGTGALTVTDLRNHQVWQQTKVEEDPACRQRVVTVDEAKREITLDCAMAGVMQEGKKAVAPFRMVLKLHATRPDVEITFTFTGQGQWRQAAYPYVFARDGAGVLNLYPHCEGMLVPVRKSDPDWLALPDGDLYGGVHSYLMCLGLIDEPTGQGLLTLLPDVEATVLRWREVLVDGQMVVAPQYIYRSNKGSFDRPWRMTFCFSDKGGYVALARRYREFFASLGLHKTLKEKAAINPEVNNIAGATVFWAAARRPKETSDMADQLKALGVDRCLFAMCNVPWRRPEEPEYQNEMATALKHIRSLGFETYRYDQYRDAFEPRPDKPHTHQINTNAWPDKIVRRPDGKMIAAFGPGSGVICSKFFMPLANEAFDREFKEFDYSAWFLDCLGSVGFNAEAECFDPKHPCDRYDTRRQREALLIESNRRGKLSGTECGLDYLIPHVHWFEGATTLVRWVEAVHPKKVTENTGINDSSGNKRRTVIAELSKLPPNTKDVDRTVSIGVRHRIPFFSLCHHDEVIVTWRWEDGMEQPPVYWQWKNLWSALYGAPPMYRIYAPRLKQYEREVCRTQKYVSDWVRQVAFDAMTDHRFLTSDRLVQETQFSSGKGVVVNFGDKDFTLPGGQVVKARDYVIFQNSGARVYVSPPCSNVFAD